MLKRFHFDIRILYTCVAFMCFTVFFVWKITPALMQMRGASLVVSVLICAAAVVFCALLLNRKTVKNDIFFCSFIIITIAGCILRLFLFDVQTGDYIYCLSQWVNEMRSLTGVKPITTPIGDYNMPYLYFLFGVARSGLYDLYMIKLFSLFFDFVLAVGAVKVCDCFSLSDSAKLFAFTALVFLPTSFMNSGYWGQCDSVYTSLCIWALYFALKEKGGASVSFFALAFSYKIQTVFILPIIVFLILRKKLKPRQTVFFPIVFLLTLAPALMCGRSFKDTFYIYIKQAGSYPSLTLNAPTFWALFPEDRFSDFGTGSLFLAGSVLLAFCAYLYINREKLSSGLLLDAAFIFTLIIPFLLPRMHERYFYPAEMLSVLYSIRRRDRFFICPAIAAIGFLVYQPFLYDRNLIPLEYLTLIMGGIIIFLIKKFVDDTSATEKVAKI